MDYAATQGLLIGWLPLVFLYKVLGGSIIKVFISDKQTHYPTRYHTPFLSLPLPHTTPVSAFHILLSLHFRRNLLLLVNKLRILGGRRGIHLLILHVPVIQVPDTRTQVRRESQPSEVGDQGSRGDGINLSPYIRQVSSDTSESNDVNGGFDGTFGPEKERHPDQVQAELDGVQRRAVFHGDELFSAGEGGGAGGVGAVGGVAHEAV